MRLKEYPRTPTVDNNTIFITDSVEKGTKGIQANLLASQLLGFLDQNSIYEWYDKIKIPVRDRRRVFRGKNLGTEVTPLQQARIRNGTFEDMFIGDYWVINEHYYIIMDFDYYMYSYNNVDANGIVSSTRNTIHHLTMMPSSKVVKSLYYNTLEERVGGYDNSVINTETIPNIINPTLETDFGQGTLMQVVLSVSNVVNTSSSEITGYIYKKFKSIIPTAVMVVGTNPRSYPGEYVNLNETNRLSYFEIKGLPISIINVFGSMWLRTMSVFYGAILLINGYGVTYGSVGAEGRVWPIFNIQYGG